MSSKFGVYRFLVYSKIPVHSFSPCIPGCVNRDYESCRVDWWYSGKASTQLRAEIHWKLRIGKLQISSSLSRVMRGSNTFFEDLKISFWSKRSQISVLKLSKLDSFDAEFFFSIRVCETSFVVKIIFYRSSPNNAAIGFYGHQQCFLLIPQKYN